MKKLDIPGNDPNSLNWHPVGEVCGVDAYKEGAYGTIINPITRRTFKMWLDDIRCDAEWKIKNYEDRRIFEDGIGMCKIAAYNADKKDGDLVVDITKSLVGSQELVKMRAAYEILEWFILGLYK